MRTATATTLALAIVLALVAPAQAEEPPAAGDEARPSPAQLKAAREKNQEGKKLFNLGQFKEAAVAYGAAYEAVPLPAFLYNLGQCHARMESAEELEKAIFYFEAYLNKQPAAPNQAEVKEEIARLEAKLETLRDHNKPVLLGVSGSAPREATPVYKKWWFWTIIGVAVAGAAAGVTVALLPGENDPVGGSLWPGVISFD